MDEWIMDMSDNYVLTILRKKYGFQETEKQH